MSNNEKFDENGVKIESVIPKNRQDLLKWNGWGYKDSRFIYENGHVYFTGKRYPIGETHLPHLADWVKNTFDIDINNPKATRITPNINDYPSSILTDNIINEINQLNIELSIETIDRLIRAHGQTLHDIYTLRNGQFKRIPDGVVWPQCHDDVVNIIRIANLHGCVLIPYGGGTAVSGAVACPTNEPRPIIVVDTTQMNRLLRLDEKNLTVLCESGIIGQDLEKILNSKGYTTGHEPDSYEFSTLGGWVATRASGMKKNTYGNIEDLIIHVRLATSMGILEKHCHVPRLSCGPDFYHIIMGSEGSFGVITEVMIKIRPIPKMRQFGSIIFPEFQAGLNCMREVAHQRCQPSSIRLMDNGQFRLGTILKSDENRLMDYLKKFYIIRWKRFNFDQIAAMTLLFEGDEDDVRLQIRKILKISTKFGGLWAGANNGERGYMLTFVIAYIRDLALDYEIVAESFETSVPWDRAHILSVNVKYCVSRECQRYGIKRHMINCRVTQTYDTGCVIYFYLAFLHANVDNPVKVHESIEQSARDEIVRNGGSISHHHGVGKIRKRWYGGTVSQLGVDLFRAIKQTLDPNNVFAVDNMIEAKL